MPASVPAAIDPKCPSCAQRRITPSHTVATAEVGIRGKLRTGDVGHALSATANTFTLKSRNADALVDTLSFVQDRLLLTVGGWLSGVGVPGVGCAAHIDRVGDAGLLTGGKAAVDPARAATIAVAVAVAIGCHASTTPFALSRLRSSRIEGSPVSVAGRCP
jgi:hypothetical protein